MIKLRTYLAKYTPDNAHGNFLISTDAVGFFETLIWLFSNESSLSTNLLSHQDLDKTFEVMTLIGCILKAVFAAELCKL